MRYLDLWDTLGLVGLLLIVAGVGMLNMAAAIVVLGVVFVLVATRGARSNGTSDRSATPPGG